MFGYIKPMPPEMRVKEYELYRAFYCGLCRAMGLHICKSSRFTLSYDIVFLALVRAAASDEKITVKHRRCIAHPLKKRPVAECEKAIPYSAAASAILSYYNVTDDIADEKGFRRFAKKCVLPTMRRYRKKAGHSILDAKIASSLEELAVLEKSALANAEACADKFGKVLSYVFAEGFGSDAEERILSDIGYHIGRWIYLVDAIDDHEKDKKSGSFNPFSSYEELPKETLEIALNLELDAAKKSLDLLSCENRQIFNIIENIIYLGMPETAKKVLGITERKENNNK